MTKRKVAILFAIILSLAFVSLGSAITVTSEIVPIGGAMTVDLKNSSNVPMNASLFVYVRDMEYSSRIRFFNVTFVITQGENHTYLKGVDDSGIEVYIKDMKPKETVSFRVKEIKVRPEFSISIDRLRIDLEPRGEATFYLDYDVVFSLIAETRLGKISVASVPTWNDGTKKIFTDVYDVFVRMEGLKWEKPRYTRIETLPFIPTGEELDQLICGCGRKLRVFLRGEKETGADPGELWAVEWKDIDMARKKLTINHPVKNHNPRILNVSDEWLRMVSRLPRTSERIWGTARYGSLYSNLWQQRKRIAFQYDNPRLKKISFRTIRHWKGTMEYHLTHDLMHVKELLGHKTVQSTEIYIHLEEKLFEQLSSEFIVKRAVSVKGMMALASIGFEKFDEVDGIHLYRKPKTAE